MRSIALKQVSINARAINDAHLVMAGQFRARLDEKNIPAIEVCQAVEVRKPEYICALIPAFPKDAIDTPILIPLVVRVRIGWV